MRILQTVCAVVKTTLALTDAFVSKTAQTEEVLRQRSPDPDSFESFYAGSAAVVSSGICNASPSRLAR